MAVSIGTGSKFLSHHERGEISVVCVAYESAEAVFDYWSKHGCEQWYDLPTTAPTGHLVRAVTVPAGLCLVDWLTQAAAIHCLQLHRPLFCRMANHRSLAALDLLMVVFTSHRKKSENSYNFNIKNEEIPAILYIGKGVAQSQHPSGVW